ncbi:MAG TPA: hypothetical protein PK156_39610 [Polyangium sp.]|nr:hypothetical protein [Polyangium sp.]
MQNKPLFHLNLTLRACMARISLNGFMLAAVNARAPISVAPPINVFLVGKGNTLKIEALPTMTREGMSSPLDIDIKGSISAYVKGDIVAPDVSGDIVLDVDLRRDLAGQTPSVPLLATLEFDNDGPAFPQLFLEAEVIEDPKPLLAYALRLRDLFAAGDVAGLVKEFAPKLRDYAAGFYVTEAAIRDEFVAFVQSTLLPGPMDLKFKETDILPVSMCDGRIWELSRKPMLPLLSTMPDKNGGQFQIPVYVARVNGELKVVR